METINKAEEQSYFQARIAAFKAKAQEFGNAFNALLNMEQRASVDPNLKAEWETLSQRGFALKDKVNFVTSKIDAAVNWFKSSFGEYEAPEQSELGILPAVALIPIAVIATSIALLTKFISDVYIFNKKISEAERLLDMNVSPEQVAKIIEASGGTPLLAGLSPIVKWVVIGGGLWVGYQVYQSYQKGS